MKSITLNLPYDLSSEEWKKVANVFEQLDGWMTHSKLCTKLSLALAREVYDAEI